MRLDAIGFDGESLLVGPPGLIQTPQFLECRAKVVVGLGKLGL
jgi:hypothetical protein